MTLMEAIEGRHTVRRYTGRKIPGEVADRLAARIAEDNEKYGLKMRLKLDCTEAFGPVTGLALGVRNTIVLAGENAADVGERLGYGGTDAMLYAQTLGLNSWWVGGSFSRKGARRSAGAAETDAVVGVIAVGYGAARGVAHRSRGEREVSRYNGSAPGWFRKGVAAALLAPTAHGRQAFFIEGDGGRVSVACDSGAFSGVERGIIQYHFEAGAGKENFEWG